MFCKCRVLIPSSPYGEGNKNYLIILVSSLGGFAINHPAWPPDLRVSRIRGSVPRTLQGALICLEVINEVSEKKILRNSIQYINMYKEALVVTNYYSKFENLLVNKYFLKILEKLYVL